MAIEEIQDSYMSLVLLYLCNFFPVSEFITFRASANS